MLRPPSGTIMIY